MKIDFKQTGAFFFGALQKFNLASPTAWRESSFAQIWLCALLGVAVSAATIAIHDLIQSLREIFFQLEAGVRLSESKNLNWKLVLIVPLCGGIVLSLSNWLLKFWRINDIVDPMEANAVHGGRMSLRDSLRLLLATVISNTSGVSIGMEAAYSQTGSGIMSWIGQKLRLRRQDLRIFVAAGSAAAIASAFNAPMAGAFYGFELILGIYTIRALPHVAAASLSSVLFMRLMTQENPIFYMPMSSISIPPWHYILFLAMGILAARIGILTMKSVTYFEKISKKYAGNDYLRPVIGGILTGFIALLFPQVLGSGQGAINDHLHNNWPLIMLLLLMVAKIGASAISVGFGFRGGLFSASLLIGCLFGQIAGKISGFILPENTTELPIFMLTGMGAVAASVVGAPVTIVLLILEMTESFSATTPVFAAVLISSIITRYTFGYSFSTWRFHVRGLRISGAFDIGWINEMSVSQMMKAKFETASSWLSIAETRDLIPASTQKRVFLVDESGFYQGTLEIATLHDADVTDLEQPVSTLTDSKEHFLLASQNIKQALDLFAEWEIEELPVLASMYDRTIKGSLVESSVLRRYAKELEAQNLAQSGAATPPVKTP